MRITPSLRALYFPRLQGPNNSIATIPIRPGGDRRKITPEYIAYRSAVLSKGDTSAGGGGNAASLICWNIDSIRWEALPELSNRPAVQAATSPSITRPTTAPINPRIPADPETFYGIALGFERGGRLDSSVRRYKAVVQKFPATPAAERAETRLQQLEDQGRMPDPKKPAKSSKLFGGGR